MLTIILKKLVECTKVRNEYVIKGHLDAANRCIDKHMVLDECLEDAGYKIALKTKPVRSTGGLFEGLILNYVTAIEVTMPKMRELGYEEMKSVKEAGFDFTFNNDATVASYKFDWKEI